MAEKKPTFEKDLERLEEIVGALEEGGLSLDDSLKHFEEGIKLARRCEKALTEAEKKIEILVKNDQGEIEAEPFGDAHQDDRQGDILDYTGEEDESDDDYDEHEDEDDGLLF